MVADRAFLAVHHVVEQGAAGTVGIAGGDRLLGEMLARERHAITVPDSFQQ